MLLLSGLSLLPDADVIGFAFGVAYSAPFGHRGASHSLVVALAIGVLAGLATGVSTDEAGASRARYPAWLRVGLLVGVVVGTHGPLDMLTDGGRGIALLWPFSTARVFAPWRPLPVAPIGLNFLSGYGCAVAMTEAVYFLPLLAYAFWPRVRSER